MNYRWLLRAKRWAQNPPSAGHVKFVLAILAACAALYLVDLVWGWPEWLTPDHPGQGARGDYR